MTREEKQKAINALKKSAPIMAMTQQEFSDYIQTINQVMDWLEQEPKMGHWITHNESKTLLTGETATGGVICSECGFKTHNKAHVVFGCPFKYCPNCGVKIAESEGEA